MGDSKIAYHVVVISKARNALYAAGRVFAVACAAFLVLNKAEIILSIGGGADRPDFSQLEGIGLGALQAGAVGVAVWGLNMIRPRKSAAPPPARKSAAPPPA